MEALDLDKDFALDLVEIWRAELGIASVLWNLDEQTLPDLAHNVDHDLLLFMVGMDLETDDNGQRVVDKSSISDGLADLTKAAGLCPCVSMCDDGFDDGTRSGLSIHLCSAGKA